MAKQRKTKKKSKKSYKFLFIGIFLCIIIPFYLVQTEKLNVDKSKHEIKDQYILEKMQKSLKIKEQDILKVVEEQKEKSKESAKKIENSFKTINDILEEFKKSEKDDNISLKKDLKDKEAKQLNKNDKIKKSQQEKAAKKIVLKEPMLAIIIDDVSFKFQADSIKKIPYKVTPSFFPPASNHPNSAKIASDFAVHMVHLPLEAQSFKGKEQRTLQTKESYKSIHKWIKKIKKWFPNAKYYNNHTGSKFTSDYESMDRLFKVLKEEKLIFVDSKTSPNTKGELLAKKYSLKILSRDVFLDNYKNANYIKKQLKQAVKIAKTKGSAIAIGHPYPETLKVLKEAKPLLKGVKLVYINEL